MILTVLFSESADEFLCRTDRGWISGSVGQLCGRKSFINNSQIYFTFFEGDSKTFFSHRIKNQLKNFDFFLKNFS